MITAEDAKSIMRFKEINTDDYVEVKIDIHDIECFFDEYASNEELNNFLAKKINNLSDTNINNLIVGLKKETLKKIIKGYERLQFLEGMKHIF